ncbi:MAG: phytanoyl-CoA dioxygenase family protein [Planctomycetota bacterium]|jgi:hypothetical protein|nr:phytanoyl-CoA dioxygenase family protein [Planctomycetota bacterium]
MPDASSVTIPTLSPEQREAFYSTGFIMVPQVFSAAEMDRIDAGFTTANNIALNLREGLTDKRASVPYQGARFTLEDNGHEHVVRHIAWVGALDAELDRLGSDPRLVGMAAQLLGCDEVQQLIHQAHYKDPGGNVAFDWHQDAEHRGMGRGGFKDLNGHGSYVQIALAVDDVTADNGPVRMIPGSPSIGYKPHNDRAIDSKWVDESQAVTPLAKRGDCLLFGPYTIHGSNPNRSDRSRRVFINGFAQPGAWQGEPQPGGIGRLLRV